MPTPCKIPWGTMHVYSESDFKPTYLGDIVRDNPQSIAHAWVDNLVGIIDWPGYVVLKPRYKALAEVDWTGFYEAIGRKAVAL